MNSNIGTDSFPILSAQELQELDERVVKEFHIPTEILMENAGKAVAKESLKILQKTSKTGTVLVICGGGNNGGDGFVAARHLKEKGMNVSVILLKPKESLRNASLSNFYRIKSLNISYEVLPQKEQIENQIKNASLIIDAVFGTGFKGKTEGIFYDTIKLINSSKKSVISVDIPSGLNADTGEAQGVSVKADTTVTFAALKKGFLNENAKQYTGKIIVVDIGLPKSLFLDKK